jgi:hypothetical protein
MVDISEPERRGGKGKERSEKGGGESIRVSTCIGSRRGRACLVERGGGERESEVELEHVSAMAVRAWLVGAWLRGP